MDSPRLEIGYRRGLRAAGTKPERYGKTSRYRKRLLRTLQRTRPHARGKGRTLGRKLSINRPRVVHETIDGEVIVIDLATGTYFSLQGGAADVWALIGAGLSSDEMATTLAAAYAASSEAINGTLDSFIAELEAESLVVADPDGGASPQAAPAINADGDFLPCLEKHTDMAELILLDPVHEVDAMGWPHRPAEDAKSAG